MAETEKRMLLSHAINRCARVLLPAPDGDDRMISKPRRCKALLHVLNLFAHLIDDHFQVKPHPGQFRSAGFRAERVGFAHEFLHQKVEFSPDLTGFGQQRPGGGDMGLQPVKLLGHISLYRLKSRLKKAMTCA